MYNRMSYAAVIKCFMFLCLLIASKSHASYVDQGRSTLDTGSGLEWLDLTETAHLSYNDVDNQMSSGAFSEYRRATAEEILALFFDFNLSDGPVNENHRVFMNLFGVTDRGFYGDQAFGYADATSYTMAPVFGLDFLRVGGVDSYHVQKGTLHHSKTHNFDGFGNYLVAERRHHPVPEIDGASAPLALGFVLMVMAMVRERRRR